MTNRRKHALVVALLWVCFTVSGGTTLDDARGADSPPSPVVALGPARQPVDDTQPLAPFPDSVSGSTLGWSRRSRSRVRKYRAELTRFLWDEELEPTNNPAERALRPMVVARKITGLRRAQSSRGSRSAPAAEAWSKLSSLLATQEQNGKNVLEETKKLLVEYWATGKR